MILGLGYFLDLLWSCEMNDLTIDLPNHRLTLSAHMACSGEDYNYIVAIDGVSGFCWINDKSEEHRLDTAPWDYSELMTAATESNCGVKVSGNSPYSLYSCNPNLVFEIWNSLLAIEAKTIRINDQSFEL